jgi:hypothetical protein
MARLLAGILACFLASGAHAQEQERAPFITTPPDVVEAMLRFAGTGPSDFVVDLGSGDGRIVIAAARTFGARALGIELEGPLVRKSRESAAAAGVADRATFVEGDVLTADILKATVVTVYLLPFLINKLQPRFLAELKPGTRIVSHAFYMAGWRPDRSETVRVAGPHPGQGGQSTLYLWVVPANARGEWRSGELRVKIGQNFQELDVEVAKVAARATLSGRTITWETPDLKFEGTVEGSRMIGELTRHGQKGAAIFERP